MNDTSSRSHQILRLTVESSAREFSGSDELRSLSATANFVDLAGSERASQTLSAGTRLKEGCHINRSLLTLGTVIRKLSKGRNGHIPFRDSKLTRILQSSLGGQARAAIICTMSPARAHVEQSRNTLLFASCAKEVATNARVNVVMSDRALVKQLQRELSRLEAELKTSRALSIPHGIDELFTEKDIQIDKLKEEMSELKQQRDIAYMELAAKESFLEERPPKIRVDLELSYPQLRVRNSFDDSPVTGSPNSEEGFLVPNYKLKIARVISSSRLSPNTPNFNVLLREENEELADEDLDDLCNDVECVDSGWSSDCKDANASEYTAAEIEEADGEGSSEVSCAESNLGGSKLESEEIEIDASSNLKCKDGENEEALNKVVPCVDPEDESSEVSYAARNSTGTKPEGQETEIDASSETEATLEHTSVKNEQVFNDEVFPGVDPEDSSQVSCSTSNLTGPKPESQEIEIDASYTSATASGISLEHTTIRNEQELTQVAPCVALQEPSEVSCAPSNLGISKPGSLGVEIDSLSPEMITAAEENKELKSSSIEEENEIRREQINHTQNLDEVGSSYRSLRLVRSRSCLARFEGVDQNIPSTLIASNMDSNGRPESLQIQLQTLRHDRPREVLTRTGTHNSSNSKETPDLLDNKQLLIEETVQAANLEPALRHASLEDGNLHPVKDYLGNPTKWASEFKRLQREIIELWHTCNISLVHRTYFFLLFKGDPKDNIYMEVEHRRLSFLKETFAKGDQTMDNGHNLTLASSARALRHERHMLSHRMKKGLSKEERENIFLRWGIGLNTKHRRSQLALRLWTDTTDMDHVAESATIVSKLVHFVDEEKSFKEMFGLTFAPRQRVHKKHRSLKRSVMSIL